MNCDWYVEHSALRQLEQESTITTTLSVARITRKDLLNIIEPWASLGRVYLSGTFTVHGVQDDNPTRMVSGETVILKFADARELETWGFTVMRNVSLSIQLRHLEQLPVPELKQPDRESAILPADVTLQKWID